MRSEVPPGTILAGFRIESLISEGALGAVYLAEAPDGRQIALKLLLPELARDERFRQRFLRESQLAASIDHPRIVATIASGEEEGLLYLAMAYVEGADLRDLLRGERRLEAERTLALLGQVAEALDAAHATGLVHRDVKPGNILVSATGDGEQAYVCDFGLARHVTSVSSLTGDRGFVGTIDYVPPEQIEGGQIDHRADVYSLGCVLYECLAGERPFERESELAVVFAHLNEPPPRLSEVRPELPLEFDSVFETALAKSPDSRYSTCGELIAAARAALTGKTFVRRAVRRRRVLVAVAAVAVAAGAAVGGLLASRGTEAEPPAVRAATGQPISLQPGALNLIDARRHRVLTRVPSSKQAPFETGVSDIAFSPGSAWVVLGNAQRLVRVDLETRRVADSIKLPWRPGGISSGGGAIWLAQDGGQEVARVDERTGALSRRGISGDADEGNAGGIAYGAGSLWLARERHVARIDPESGHVSMLIPATARYLVFGNDAVMAAAPGGRVWKIDPVQNRIVASATLQGFVSDLAVGGGYVWLPVRPGNVVFKLNDDDLGVQVSPAAGEDPERVSFGDGRLWIANTTARTISLLDQVSGTRRQLVAEAGPTMAVYHDGLVWAAATPSPTPLPPIEGEEVRISTPTDSGVRSDPRSTGPNSEQIMYATCARLLDYPDATGAEGQRLQPEIAAAMPRVNADGRTYTFRIRSGFRFSPPSNEPVTAETFRHTIERVAAEGHAWPFVPEIVGAAAFSAGRARHISGISARGDRLVITLARPAGDFVTRISMPPFCPVPLSVPLHGPVHEPLPSAGPYYVSSIERHRAVLLRNPNYHGSRPQRAERIVYTNDTPTPKALALADAGAVDLLPQDFDNTTSLLNVGSPLDRRSGADSKAARAGRQQFYLYPAPFLDYIAFNTRRPLFRDARLRRAVNYALDRRELASALGDIPDDQVVPLSVPGFTAGRIYPIERPNLTAARRLAGRERRRAVIYACGDPRLLKLSKIVKANLARINVVVSILQSDTCSGRDADLTFGMWGLGPAERDPAPFVDMAIGGAYGWPRPEPGPWNDRGFRKRLERARALRGHARLESYRRLDDELMRMAPFAVYGSWVWAEYLSPKTGCRVFQGFYGFVDLGTLCKQR